MGKLSEAMVALDKEGVLAAVTEDIRAGRDPLELVHEARVGLEEVGSKFELGELYLLELMRAAQIFQSAAEVLNPKIAEVHGGVTAKGKIVIGTVAGDIHDLGKNIVKILLECKGVEVIDLGVDVPAQSFVEKTREHKPQVVGMSALLTASVPEMNKTITALEEAGLRKDIKIICGGGIVGELRSEMKSDYAAIDANEGIRVIEGWLS
jgi:5-methyltetrahydrofolate--homocysteine methyltransferase